MPDNEELDVILESLMEDLHDRAGTGGRDEENDPPLEGDYHGDDK